MVNRDKAQGVVMRRNQEESEMKRTNVQGRYVAVGSLALLLALAGGGTPARAQAPGDGAAGAPTEPDWAAPSESPADNGDAPTDVAPPEGEAEVEEGGSGEGEGTPVTPSEADAATEADEPPMETIETEAPAVEPSPESEPAQIASEPEGAVAEEGDEAQEEEAEEAEELPDVHVTIGLKGGIAIPSLFNDLGVNGNLTLEVGIPLPVLDRRLAVVLEGGWSPPGNDASLPDPRVDGGDGSGEWDFDVTSHQTYVSLGLVFRIFAPGTFINPYVGALARMYILKTHVTGTGGGNAFGANDETSTEFGGVGLLGLEIGLGPGAALVELSFGGSSLPHRITGDSTTMSLGLAVGYRIFL